MLNTFEIPLEQLKAQLNEISHFINYVSSSDISRSTVSYNAAIISLYGCYENYVNSLIEELIRQISDNSNDYHEIPSDMIIQNIILSSDFLSAPNRFKNFNLQNEDVINNLYSGKITNKLLLKHSGNLSITVLSDYMKKSLGIRNVVQSIKDSNDYLLYYSKKKMISPEEAKSYLNNSDNNTAFNILDDIISQRNTIAHSWKSDDKIDFEIIKNEWIPFINSLCKCLYGVVTNEYVNWLIKHNKLFNAERYVIYGSSIVGFRNLKWKKYSVVVIKEEEKLRICNILETKFHLNDNVNVTIKIDGYKLDKKRTGKYIFYFKN